MCASLSRESGLPIHGSGTRFLDGGGQMGAQMRAINWAATSLGLPDSWSPDDKTAVSICLNSHLPILLWLGPELRLIYNDASIPILGKARHPVLFGEPGRATWGKMWGTIAPILKRGSHDPQAPLTLILGPLEGVLAEAATKLNGETEEMLGSRLSEQRLRESEEHVREFADHSTNVIWIVDEATSRLAYLSPAFDRVWGSRPTGQPMLADLLAGIIAEDRWQVGDALARVRSGESTVHQHRIVRPDGAVRWIHHTMFPILNADGRIHRLGGIAQDITKERTSPVYLIEDGEQTDLASQLNEAGYSVTPFASARAFLKVAPTLLPGCVVLDISRSGASELDVVRECKARRSRHTIIVLGNSHGNVGKAVDAMKAGAVDWLEMPYRTEALLSSIAAGLAEVAAVNGHEKETELAQKRISALSSREQDVLHGLVAGRTNKEIGRDIGISPRTVEIHRSHLMHRLGVETLPEAVLLAAAAGLHPSRRT